MEGNSTSGYWPYPIMGDNTMQTTSGVKVNVMKANAGRLNTWRCRAGRLSASAVKSKAGSAQ